MSWAPAPPVGAGAQVFWPRPLIFRSSTRYRGLFGLDAPIELVLLPIADAETSSAAVAIWTRPFNAVFVSTLPARASSAARARRRGDRIECNFAALHMSASGTKRRFAATRTSGRYWG